MLRCVGLLLLAFVHSKPSSRLSHRRRLSYAQLAKLTAADGDSRFGSAVATSGDNVAVGAYSDDAAGAVYVLRASDGAELAKLTPNEPDDEDGFGRSVAIDGGTVVVGAYRAGTSGAVYIFSTTDSWTSELVSQRIRKTGESEETARQALSTDPTIIQAVAVGAGVPPSELAIELSEFRLEMRESFQKVEGQLDALTPKLDEIRASALTPRFRDKVVTKSFFREQLPSSVEKKKARREDRRLAQLELELDSVRETPFAAGGQGSVFLGESEGEPIVLKKVPLIGIIQSEREKILASFRREVKIACEVRSQRCVRLLGVVTVDPTYVGLVTEYLEGGSLRAALSAEGAIEESRKRTWAADVAQGMKYLYAHGIEHRDLKSGNVLLTSGKTRAKVADFGLSRCEELNTMTQTKAVQGTAAYMAPELLEDNLFDEKSDVYSYGILLWEIYDRGVPWRGLQPMQIMRKVVDKNERPPLPSSMPDDLRTLAGTCWSPGPDDRPDFQTIASVLHAPRSPAPVPPAATGQGTTKPLA